MHRSLLPSLAALVPAAAALAGSRPGDEATFHPGGHSILTKAFAEDLAVEMDSFDVLVDGEPVQEDMPEIRFQGARRVTLGDEYVEVDEGRVKKLLRTHERISGEATVAIEEEDDEEHTAPLESELTDAVVLFEWNEQRGAYDRKFEEGGTGSEEHLARLEPEADFLGFLPTGPVDADDTWQVDAAALAGVFAPGGDLRVMPSSLGGVPYVNMEMPAMIGASVTFPGEVGDAWQGTIKATYTGAREEEGVRVGRIELEVEATAEVDLHDAYERAVEELGQDFDFTFIGMVEEWKVSGRGELLWDLDGGHVHAFKLEADVEIQAHLSWEQPILDQKLKLEGIYRLSGTARTSMTLEE